MAVVEYRKDAKGARAKRLIKILCRSQLNKNMKKINCFIILSVCLLTGLMAQVQGPVMRVHIIDVGQGLSALIEFPCGVILVDSGGESNNEFQSTDALIQYLDKFFIRRND